MIGVYILAALSLAVAIVTLVAVISLARRKDRAGVTGEDLRFECEKLREHVENDMRLQNSALVGSINAQVDSSRQMLGRTEALANANVEKIDKIGRELTQSMNNFRAEQIDRLAESSKETINQLNLLKQSYAQSMADLRAEQVNKLVEMTKELSKQLDVMRQANAQALAELRAYNEAELEKIRQTVDEKLSETLDKRFNQSFQLVNERLEEINRTFAELQSLQSGVKDLNKLFSNVKTRGTWGEVSLKALLEQILIPSQYAAQVKLPRSSVVVDFAIRMPGKGDDEVLLPIDAKFPVEAYGRLQEAAEKGEREAIDAAVKSLSEVIKAQAKSISEKYIKPPKTTDFAIMYLPTEGLYAEVVRNTVLLEELQQKYRVVVCGPTTIAALLNSLQMGFQSLAVEKRSKEIGKLFRAFIGDFAKFETLLQRTHQNITTVGNTLDKAEARTAKLRTQLNKVYELTKDDLDELPAGGNGADELPSVDGTEDADYDIETSGDDEN